MNYKFMSQRGNVPVFIMLCATLMLLVLLAFAVGQNIYLQITLPEKTIRSLEEIKTETAEEESEIFEEYEAYDLAEIGVNQFEEYEADLQYCYYKANEYKEEIKILQEFADKEEEIKNNYIKKIKELEIRRDDLKRSVKQLTERVQYLEPRVCGF